MKTVIAWFRRDLRLQDNAAWAAAVGSGTAVIPLYIHSTDQQGLPEPESPSGWWLHHALADLRKHLDTAGTPLVLMKGDPVECLGELAGGVDIAAVYWNRCYEPQQVREEAEVAAFLREKGIEAVAKNSLLMVPPENVLNTEQKPFKVYSAFARAWSKQSMENPIKASRPSAGHGVLLGVDLDDLGLPGQADALRHLDEHYKPTREGALAALENFANGPISTYKRDRDYPAKDGTSRLSPYLHWGQIGPREIHARVTGASGATGSGKFVSELAWREFAYYILHHFPYTVEEPFRPEYREFPWNGDTPELIPWKEGKTGFPLVDAGMRELQKTGYVHNRVRMLVASVLVKHLMISWRTGADFFMRRLIDADLANNTLGWQWVAGCGVDAAPYFRVFNPVLQSRKFDSKGEYIRKYVPELENVPDKYVHEPWTMPDQVQHQAGCVIGSDYPEPVVGLMEGRIRALSAWKSFNNPEQQALKF